MSTRDPKDIKKTVKIILNESKKTKPFKFNPNKATVLTESQVEQINENPELLNEIFLLPGLAVGGWGLSGSVRNVLGPFGIGWLTKKIVDKSRGNRSTRISAEECKKAGGKMLIDWPKIAKVAGASALTGGAALWAALGAWPATKFWKKCKKGSGEITNVATPATTKRYSNWDGGMASRVVRKINKDYSNLQQEWKGIDKTDCAAVKAFGQRWKRQVMIPAGAASRVFASLPMVPPDQKKYVQQAKMFADGGKNWWNGTIKPAIAACTPAPGPGPGPGPRPRPTPRRRCGKPGSAYGQRGFMPAKKKSAKGDAEFDKFYADLKGAGVALRGGEDYNWGRNHKRAYKKLLCKMDAGYKTPEEAKPETTDTAATETPKSKWALCGQVSVARIREWNKNRQKFGLEVLDMEKCQGIAYMNAPNSPYQGLTKSEIDQVTTAGPEKAEKKAEVSPQEALEAREDAQAIYEMAKGWTRGEEEKKITAIVEKHLQQKSIGLLFNFYDRVLAKEGAQDRGDLVRELYHEDLPELAKKVRVALQRETRGKEFRSDYEAPMNQAPGGGADTYKSGADKIAKQMQKGN